MIRIDELKTTCNEIVKAAFPDMAVYGNDTVDGYEPLSFFSEILSKGLKHSSRNYMEKGATYKLTLFEKTHDEAFCLDVFEKIQEAFGMTIRIGNRYLLVGEISSDFIGENANILQISIDFDWIDAKPRKETEEIMQEIYIHMDEGDGR